MPAAYGKIKIVHFVPFLKSLCTFFDPFMPEACGKVKIVQKFKKSNGEVVFRPL